MKNTVSPQKGLTRAGLRSNKDAALCLNKPKDTVRGVIINKKDSILCIFTHLSPGPWKLWEGWGGYMLQINLTDGINRHFRHRLLLFYFNVPHFIIVFCFFALLLIKMGICTLLDIAPGGGFMGAGPEVHRWRHARVCVCVGQSNS